MVNFRHLKITNESNTESIELNDFDGYLMTSPTGFGIYRTSEYITVGNQRINASNKASFQKITFNVLILGGRSEWEIKYANLRDFISRNLKNGFRLYYTPHETTRYIKCDINMVDKTEKDKANLPIRFEVQPLSLWLSDVNKSSVQQQGDSGNLFAFTENSYGGYSAKFKLKDGVLDEYGRLYYSIAFGGGATESVTLINNGTESTPLKVKIYGTAINPVVRLTKYGSGKLVQYASFNNLEIPEGYYLEINSDPANTYIELVNNDTNERFDREEFADIESNIYLTLPQGKFVLDVKDESGTNKCYAEIFYANQYYGG